MPLRSIAATRYVTPLRERGSLPALVEADDDGLYVLKFRGAGQGRKALIAEVAAGELARALGLGGRDRKASSHSERARVNVTRAIRSTFGRIAEHDRGLADELQRTIRTGTFCSYVPDPRWPVSWTVEA